MNESRPLVLKISHKMPNKKSYIYIYSTHMPYKHTFTSKNVYMSIYKNLYNFVLT